jgi:putative holliday junction resolvase
MLIWCVRVLCLDVGDKRIGFAISDPNQKIAQALMLYERQSSKADLERIRTLVREHGVSTIVLGLPKNLDGSIGVRAQEVQNFAEKIGASTGLPVDLWDERFSSNEAHRIFDMASVKRKKRKPFIDMMAAQLILQGYLDAQARA